MGSAIAADGNKTPIALAVGFASELNGVAGSGGGDDVDAQAALAEAREGRPGKLRGTAAAGRWNSAPTFARSCWAIGIT